MRADGLNGGSIGLALRVSRPQAMGALLRQFGELDRAEDAFQEASLRALEHWPSQGLPRDPAAWLIRVGRNAGIDEVRRRNRFVALPDEEMPTEVTMDMDAILADQVDTGCFGDDVLRLLFTCCHPALPLPHQIALALRIVSGLTVSEIARAFLVGESAMEQRITRAKRKISAERLRLEVPGQAEREQRVHAVASMIYLLFNEGYAASGGEVHIRGPLCVEAIRLSRLLLRLFPTKPEIMGLTALLLLQHARTDARLDDRGAIILLDQQDRSRWDQRLIAEGLVLVEKAFRHRKPGTYQIQAAIAAVHSRAEHPDATDWAEIDRLYAVLERIQPSPVVSLNRAVAIAKTRGPEAALTALAPLEQRLASYFPFVGLKGALLKQSGRPAEARLALERALTLARTRAETDHIRNQLDSLGS